MDDKINLRKIAKEIRKTLPLAQKSEVLAEMIRQSNIFQSAKNVMLYYPAKYEINLLSLICKDKNFYLPRVNCENIEVCKYDIGDRVQKSALNILEPCSESVDKKNLDLVIVPALMCDKKGYRLGYGGGFYDRFLSDLNVKTICAIPKELYIEKLPAENFDVKIDKIFII